MATDTKSPGEKLSVTSKTTLTLKPRAETGVVRQSFSHGRSKAVVVEKVRSRRPGEGKAEAAPATPVRAAAAVAVPTNTNSLRFIDASSRSSEAFIPRRGGKLRRLALLDCSRTVT